MVPRFASLCRAVQGTVAGEEDEDKERKKREVRSARRCLFILTRRVAKDLLAFAKGCSRKVLRSAMTRSICKPAPLSTFTEKTTLIHSNWQILSRGSSRSFLMEEGVTATRSEVHRASLSPCGGQHTGLEAYFSTCERDTCHRGTPF